MQLKRVGRSMIAATLLVSASLFVIPNGALAAPDVSDDTNEDVSGILAPTINDDLFETSSQLEEAGVLGARSELASLIGDSQIAEDGALELLYFSGDARSETLLKLIDSVNISAPLKVRAVPVETDPVKLNMLAERISLGGAGDLEVLGVPSVSGMRADAERGLLVVYVPDEIAATARTAVIEGIPVEFAPNVNVQTQSRD